MYLEEKYITAAIGTGNPGPFDPQCSALTNRPCTCADASIVWSPSHADYRATTPTDPSKFLIVLLEIVQLLGQMFPSPPLFLPSYFHKISLSSSCFTCSNWIHFFIYSCVLFIQIATCVCMKIWCTSVCLLYTIAHCSMFTHIIQTCTYGSS